MPYLYHATPLAAASSIAKTGLNPQSREGTDSYVSLSTVYQNACTLNPRSTDIMFRVEMNQLDRQLLRRAVPTRADCTEQRYSKPIPVSVLQYRFKSSIGQAWHNASNWPEGIPKRRLDILQAQLF